MKFSHCIRALLLSSVAIGTLAPSAYAATSADSEVQELRREMADMRREMQSMRSELHNQAATTHHEAHGHAAKSERDYDGETEQGIHFGQPQQHSFFQHNGQGARPFLMPGQANAPTPYAIVTGMPTGPGQQPARKGTFSLGDVTITLGGFMEAAGIFRTRNETADISSNFGAIPWKNSANAHMNEFHESERQSRFAALVQGDISRRLHVAAYTEMDFQGAGSSSNSRQSNSYVLRSRLFYGEIDNHEDDWQVAGGQMWSLATMFKKGMSTRDENIPLVIDAQYIPGFTWTRNTGFRVVKGFDHGKYHVGLALENPQSVWGVGSGGTYLPSGSKSVTITNTGGQVYNSDTTYSDDVAPDIILKASADPSFGHFELTGVGRFLHDRVSYTGTGKSHTVFAGGGGGAMLIPIIPHKFDFQASGLVGNGIGRYGTTNLADATLDRYGRPVALPEAQVLVGLIGHPAKSVDLYAYGGMEDILNRSSFNVGSSSYGYGNPKYVTGGCSIESSASSTCQASIKTVAQGTVGMWWRYFQGSYGTLMAGAQYSHTSVTGFRGVGGTPTTDDNMFFLSMRYLPFQ